MKWFNVLKNIVRCDNKLKITDLLRSGFNNADFSFQTSNQDYAFVLAKAYNASICITSDHNGYTLLVQIDKEYLE